MAEALLNIPTPGKDEIALTDDEVRRITGAGTRQLQIEWLTRNRWHFTLTRGGDPVVGRLYANLKMGGVEMATMAIDGAWEPDHTALN